MPELPDVLEAKMTPDQTVRLLKRNMAKCNACGDVVESVHQHDFRRCGCRQLAVDGGLAYERRLYGASGYTDMSEYE